MKFNKPVGSFVVLTRYKQKEVFLVKRSDFPVWEPQGGAIEDGEIPEQCAIREAYEETGFKIKIVKKVAEYTSPKANTIDSYVFEGKVVHGIYKREYQGCEGKWFNIKNLPKNMTYVRRMMISDLLNHDNKLIRRKSIPLVSIQNFKLFMLMPIKSATYLIKKTIKF